NGTGYSFPQAYGSPYHVPGYRVRITLADLDRDGRPDVIAATAFPTEVRILLNRSVGRACRNIDGCASNRCNRNTGQCTPMPKFFGSACDDHNVCTTNDSCISGWCQGPAISGLACDDENACSDGDTCGEGVCTGTSMPGPQEGDSSVRVSRIGSDAIITWILAADATTSSVLRGHL